MRLPTKAEWGGVGRWLKNDLAEWFIGSWALLLGWFIFLTIFFNFLEMDGYFSRGLGEGSGVNPDLFMHIGWMFRLFAAVFLTLSTKFATKDMKGQAGKMKVIGTFCTIIVIAHAMGFGLKALHGKYANANAVGVVAESVTQSNEQIIATLTAQKDNIRADLARQTAPLEAEIRQYITDGKDNDALADDTRARRTELENNAQAKIDAIDGEILKVTTQSGTHEAQSAKDKATAEPWPPLFVGLAQLTSWSETPTDGQIFLAGVIFLMCWILLGDAICIFLPPALYALHLKDAKPRVVRVSPDVFADLQAQADELAKRKANLDEGVDKALKTKGRRRRRADAIKMITDQRAEAAKTEEVEIAAPEPQEGAGEDLDETGPDDAETDDGDLEPQDGQDDAPDADTDEDEQQDKAA